MKTAILIILALLWLLAQRRRGPSPSDDADDEARQRLLDWAHRERQEQEASWKSDY